ncbi:hypothetical protein QWZ10_15785 [Paracoccus cavernae]|uniref:L-seryl-tRNA selenium transferase N-terminal domain-containing protein n=1 Tax=Paracoccus cavernae TaxID=1571207 RepID=A0ABT8DBY5_9RHOB|nr:hypothetical protein [Paracoccus cavernae]
MEGLRNLPSVDRLLAQAGDLVERYGRQSVTAALRAALADTRSLRADPLPDAAGLLGLAADALAQGSRSGLRPILNLTESCCIPISAALCSPRRRSMPRPRRCALRRHSNSTLKPAGAASATTICAVCFAS